MEIKNPYWFKHVSLNEKQRKELEAYERKLQKSEEDSGILMAQIIFVDSFDDEEEYIFDKDTIVF